MPFRDGRQRHFDVPYGLSSAALTSGKNDVATTGGSYHGIVMVASATQLTITIYDSAAATAGNVIDMFVITAAGDVWIDRYIPIKAKHGITVDVSGGLGKGAIFYAPKG